MKTCPTSYFANGNLVYIQALRHNIWQLPIKLSLLLFSDPAIPPDIFTQEK